MQIYGVSASDYLRRAQALVASSAAENLFYAALEIRSGVEARLQEYLSPHQHVPSAARSEWRVGKLHKTVQKALSLRVSRVVWRDAETGQPLAIEYYTPVTDRLKELAERLGERLHSAKRFYPPSDPFWADFRSQIDEAIILLSEAVFGNLMGPALQRVDDDGATRAHIVVSGALNEALSSLFVGRRVALEIRYFDDLASARSDID